VELYIFYFLSALGIFSAFMTVFSRNPVHSILYLVVFFFAITGHYLLLNAQFLAMVNIIVYVGAIMVLFLSTLMLMNLNEETEQHKPALARLGAVIASGLLMLVLIAVLKKADMMPVPLDADPMLSTVKHLGVVLLDQYLFPFEFASVLFLSSMIGAVLLSKKDKPTETTH
jgi:NADH-quinone oxidoreductase subunit J